jgi:hypothetical protein
VTQDEAIAVCVIVGILILGKWLFGGKACWRCGGSGVDDIGSACEKCGGSGAR